MSDSLGTNSNHWILMGTRRTCVMHCKQPGYVSVLNNNVIVTQFSNSQPTATEYFV